MNDLDDSTLSGAAYRVLYQIAERATSGESLHAFVQALHHLLAELMPVKNLYLCLVNAHADGLNFPYYVDERDGDSMQEADVPIRRGLTEFVLRTQASQLIDQTRYAALQNLGEITEATGDLSFFFAISACVTPGASSSIFPTMWTSAMATPCSVKTYPCASA